MRDRLKSIPVEFTLPDPRREHVTRDDIIAMAREAGLAAFVQYEKTKPMEALEAFFHAAYAAGAKDEREACAQVCEAEWSNVAERMYGEECAAAIRARSAT